MTVEEDAKKMTQGIIEILKPHEHDFKTNEERMEFIKSAEFKEKFNAKMNEVLGEKV